MDRLNDFCYCGRDGTDMSASGWDDHFRSLLRELAPEGGCHARVIGEHGVEYRLVTPHGEMKARVTGKVLKRIDAADARPVVGDWVIARVDTACSSATIHEVLPRRTSLSRRAPGRRTRRQVLASNIDWAMIMTSLNANYSLRRIERYLIMSREGGARPVLILTKSDLCTDVERRLNEVGGVAQGAPVHAVSALTGEGIDDLAVYFSRSRTTALLGSSGVGKSTLINRLAHAEIRPTADVRVFDEKGRHTTATRDLILLPGGGLVIDTPGMREVRLAVDSGTVEGAFEDIVSAASACRFRNCRHESEPGCAVREMLTAGALDEARYASYQKLLKEVEHERRRANPHAARRERERWKKLIAEAKTRSKLKGR